MLLFHESSPSHCIVSPRTRDIGPVGDGTQSSLAVLTQRAQLIRMAADGVQNQEIAKRLKISRPTM